MDQVPIPQSCIFSDISGNPYDSSIWTKCSCLNFLICTRKVPRIPLYGSSAHTSIMHILGHFRKIPTIPLYGPSVHVSNSWICTRISIMHTSIMHTSIMHILGHSRKVLGFLYYTDQVSMSHILKLYQKSL